MIISLCILAYLVAGLLSSRAWWIHMHRVQAVTRRTKTEFNYSTGRNQVFEYTPDLKKLYPAPKSYAFWTGVFWPIWWPVWWIKVGGSSVSPVWKSFWGAFYADPKAKELDYSNRKVIK